MIIPNTIYNFVEGYNLVDELEPGRGYWLRSSGNGDVVVSLSGNDNSLPRSVDRIDERYNVIDINGIPLYFGGNLSDKVLLSYSLPPLPPEGAVDIRFSDDMRYCRDGCVIEAREAKKFFIEYDIMDGSSWVLISANQRYELNGRGKLDIKNEGNLILKSK